MLSNKLIKLHTSLGALKATKSSYIFCAKTCMLASPDERLLTIRVCMCHSKHMMIKLTEAIIYFCKTNVGPPLRPQLKA
jgi:hypothetical protein